MAKRDMNDLLKRRMSATQQAAEVTVGDEAYEMLFQGKLASSASKFCDLPLDRLRPFFTADIGFHPYPQEKLKVFSQQLAEQGCCFANKLRKIFIQSAKKKRRLKGF